MDKCRGRGENPPAPFQIDLPHQIPSGATHRERKTDRTSPERDRGLGRAHTFGLYHTIFIYFTLNMENKPEIIGNEVVFLEIC